MDYTIIGGTVNTASRLEEAAEPGQILISYETYALISEQIECQEKGQIFVKGIAYPVSAYSVVGPRGSASNAVTKFHESHSGMRLEIDRTAMSSKEKAKTTEALKRALRYIRQ